MLQERYYSNLGQAAHVANLGGINNSELDLQVTSSVNWPTTQPYVLSIDPGLSTEELVLVTAGAGTALSPFTVARGYNNTLGQPHSFNAMVVPKICELDLTEPAQHIQLSGSASGAHGLPASAWLGGQYQLIYKNVLSVSTGSVNISSTYFNAIPSTCNNVVVLISAKSSYTVAPVEDLMVQINGYTGANYGDTYAQYALTSPTTSGTPGTIAHWTATQGVAGLVWTSNLGPEGVGRSTITFPFYNETVWSKGYTFQSCATDGISSANNAVGGGTCSQVTAAVNQLIFFPQFTGGGSQFLAGSDFSMYCY